MLKNTVERKKHFQKSIFLFLITLLLLASCGYLIYINISDKKIANKNTNNLEQLETKNNFKKEEFYAAKDETKAQNTRSFNESNLINDNRGVPVLYYHSVRKSADNEVIISPEMLKTQLKYIKDQGYITLTISELKNYILNNSPIPEKSIVITFDDGYMDNYYNAFPILKDFNMVATIFCITSNLDGSYYLSENAIKEMSDYGIDIQSHTVTHPQLNKLTYNQQLSELKESKKTLEYITGKKIDSIAFPYGNFNDETIKAAKDAGYALGFTTRRGLSDRGDNPLRLDRIYISSKYSMDTFKDVLAKTEK